MKIELLVQFDNISHYLTNVSGLQNTPKMTPKEGFRAKYVSPFDLVSPKTVLG